MRKFKTIISMVLILSIVTLTTGCVPKTASTKGFVQVYETTGTKSKLLARESDITFSDIDDASVNTVIAVNEKDIRQEVEGFGGALTHSSAYVLSQLPDDERKDVLESLYGDDGASFDIVRIPIGSSDYTTYIDGEMQYFTLCDTPDNQPDEKLENFSIEYDKMELIPVLKEILSINPDVKIIAASWSAPAWMKDSNHLNRGSLLEEYEELYGTYLTKYLKSYKEEGIEIDYLSVQNEPLLGNHNYPVMGMDEYQQARIIKSAGKQFEKAGFDTKFFIYDHNYDATISTTVDDYIAAIMTDKEAKKYVEAVALHGYGTFEAAEDFGLGFQVYNEKYKIKSFLTEIAEGIWSADFARNMSYSLESMIMTPLNLGSSGTSYWNLALYQDGTPAMTTNDCLGVINVSKEDGSISKNSAFYAMAHVSKFIDNDEGGAKVIGCESDNPEVLASAFLRADGHIVTVVTNLSDKYATEVDVHYDEKSFTYEIQPQSVVSFVW